ncbi:MAG: IS4/Tn5 family transposase DNA-binding protein, partial [Burkholderiales bacterium]
MGNEAVREARQQIGSAVAESNTWIDRELVDTEFCDERLGKRFRSLLQRLAASPGQGIPLACQDWANTKAAYRFLDNRRVSETEILAGHFEATRERAAATDGPILVLHDTTEFSYKREDIAAVCITRKAVAGKYRGGALRHGAVKWFPGFMSTTSQFRRA